MFCRSILNFIIRCQIALYQGFIEYCQKGCLIGSRYLVKPNYHVSERRLWFGFFIIWNSIGLFLINYYLNNFSENVYRIAIEEHKPKQDFNYPTLGICEYGIKDDQETLNRVESVLNGSLYKQFPSLRENNMLRDFIYLLAFQNLQRKWAMRTFINYTETLNNDIKDYLENYNYTNLVEKIRSNCSEFFIDCAWLDSPFDCCYAFRQISTMLGKCFVFNSNQTYSPVVAEMLKEIRMFEEPYRLHANFKRAARIYILNNNDIPETIAPLHRYRLIDRGVTLSLEFHVVPFVNDPSLENLDPLILRCVQSDKKFAEIDNDNGFSVYPFESYTSCITKRFYEEQTYRCNCKNVYFADIGDQKVPFCKLSEYACLELNHFINPRSISNNISHEKPCLPTCQDSEYVMENAYYSETSTSDDYSETYTLDFVFLNWPTIHRRRQTIRKSEDKLVSFSGILGLFMGLNLTNILELIFLTFRAFRRYKTEDIMEQNIEISYQQSKIKRPQAAEGRRRSKNSHIMLKP